jgi:predicted ATPase
VTSEHVYKLLAPQLENDLVLSPDTIMRSYERFEMLLFLVTLDGRAANLDASNLSTGLIRSGGSILAPRARPVAELESASGGGRHPWIEAGLFDGDKDRFETLIASFESYFTATHPGFFGRSPVR